MVLFSGGPTLAQVPPTPSTRVLSPVPPAKLPPELGLDEQLASDRTALLQAIDHSLQYLRAPSSQVRYRDLAIPGITHERVVRSLVRFRQLLLDSPSPHALQTAVRREFELYQSVGFDRQGTVAFTGYFEPTYRASRQPTSEYRYPLYQLPQNFAQWSKPNPSRAELESGPLLRGLELVWLRDRLEAFLVHVQGSARLQMTDGTVMSIGYAGKTDQPYTGLGRELVRDGKIRQEDLNLPVLIRYFQQNPSQLDIYLPRNRSFVFFRETNGAPATGSLGVPVTTWRSIATDRSLMPPGALALIQSTLPIPNASGQLEQVWVSRYLLDQDTGGAIRGAGRVDVFMGTGSQAEAQAGLTNAYGRLYYLLLR
ncbi:murein transglycosylase A [Leptolyngbya sp. FACHB-261]|uniref:murein transglycosylase A n=1 Tax=Leptolyngbya sp. FACHB-261 TaxID=2692806 RepID=UPI001F54BF6F|nr:MltA domain-containing protein [Leptolyngbya sp. FACHB-261]